jgi:predicted lipoprotein with Yx(FWY)xxD motif
VRISIPSHRARRRARATALAAALAVLSLAALPAGVKVQKAAAGEVLADSKGMTLYTFDNDAMPGKSACTGPCVQIWPPLSASADAKPAGEWTVLTRDDGSKQWAYKGKPLYKFAKDSKPGDTTGDGFNKVWHVAKP